MALYLPAATGLYLAAVGNTSLLSPSLSLLAAQLVLLLLGGVFAPREADQRVYLVGSVVVVFTFARVLFWGALPGSAAALLSSLILGGTLVVYVSATKAQVWVRGTWGVTLRRLLPLGATLGLAFAVFEATAPSTRVDPAASAVFAALGAGIVAFLDEFWFRGLVQVQMEDTSGPVAGWLATAALFVAAAAPQGDAILLLYRACIGLALGFVVMRYRLLPLALIVRTTAAVAAILLTGLLPGFTLGT